LMLLHSDTKIIQLKFSEGGACSRCSADVLCSYAQMDSVKRELKSSVDTLDARMGKLDANIESELKRRMDNLDVSMVKLDARINGLVSHQERVLDILGANTAAAVRDLAACKATDTERKTPNMSEGKEHLSIVICGHVDSGKSTTTGRLLFELGGFPEHELEKLKVLQLLKLILFVGRFSRACLNLVVGHYRKRPPGWASLPSTTPSTWTARRRSVSAV
jgi:hypothetical protein